MELCPYRFNVEDKRCIGGDCLGYIEARYSEEKGNGSIEVEVRGKCMAMGGIVVHERVEVIWV